MALKAAVRDPVQLCRMLRLPARHEQAAVRAARAFSVLAPLGYVARMRPGDPHDPLLRQVLPLADERADVPGFTADPVADARARRAPGLLQKYRGRALLVTTPACAIHCRYCFRRHYPYGEDAGAVRGWRPALEEISGDSAIEEAVLSGGDPLTLLDSQLAELVRRLEEIPHLRRLRVHTRLPIVIPERVTGELLALLRAARLAVFIVVHANHPAELSDLVCAALDRLVGAGLPVLNQSVLLRGVNDDVDILAELCRLLVNHGVTPYYLHQLDRVSGAAHFETPIEEGIQLIEQLRARLPGYAVPRYVQEAAGEPGKRVLA
jgi:EF-P beta-lysylation protein EpmB